MIRLQSKEYPHAPYIEDLEITKESCLVVVNKDYFKHVVAIREGLIYIINPDYLNWVTTSKAWKTFKYQENLKRFLANPDEVSSVYSYSNFRSMMIDLYKIR